MGATLWIGVKRWSFHPLTSIGSKFQIVRFNGKGLIKRWANFCDVTSQCHALGQRVVRLWNYGIFEWWDGDANIIFIDFQQHWSCCTGTTLHINFIIFVPRTLTAHSSSRIIIKSWIMKLLVGLSLIVGIYRRNSQYYFCRIILSHCFVTVIVASCCRDLVAIWVGSIVAICRRDIGRKKISGEH